MYIEYSYPAHIHSIFGHLNEGRLVQVPSKLHLLQFVDYSGPTAVTFVTKRHSLSAIFQVEDGGEPGDVMNTTICAAKNGEFLRSGVATWRSDADSPTVCSGKKAPPRFTSATLWYAGGGLIQHAPLRSLAPYLCEETLHDCFHTCIPTTLAFSVYAGHELRCITHKRSTRRRDSRQVPCCPQRRGTE